MMPCPRAEEQAHHSLLRSGIIRSDIPHKMSGWNSWGVDRAPDRAAGRARRRTKVG
jgi:hypothetical protein